MRILYEKIGIDAIDCLGGKDRDFTWKYNVVFYMSMSNCFNTLLLMLVFAQLDIKFPTIEITLFNSKQLNSLCWFFLELLIPFGVLNYILFFYKNRYKKLIVKYKRVDNRKGRFIIPYVVFSAFLYLFVVLLGYFLI